MITRNIVVAAALILAPSLTLRGQDSATHADIVRGTNGPARAWREIKFYDLHVRIDPADSSISGWNRLTYRTTHPAKEMQIDLQGPLQIDSVHQDAKGLPWRQDGAAYFITLLAPQPIGLQKTVTIYYHGKPKSGPWRGFSWSLDSLGHTWAATSNQLPGASTWWPMKDLQSSEPDSQRIVITIPASMVDISNGRLRSTTPNSDSTVTYEWFVSNPINGYDVAVNAGTYAHFSDTYQGEGGKLTLDFWPIAYHLDTAQAQFQQAKPMLACFEHWFGPYPWYNDGYKLVEVPYLGMEHQTAVAYGNRYLKGYLGRDLSGTGHGLSWDYIIIHESAHEWFGNSVTAADPAEDWIHEGFANYAEGLYVECQQGKQAESEYFTGLRKGIKNAEPIIGPLGVGQRGAGDMYPKGANLLHLVRQLVANDEKWRGILRGLSRTYRHQIVTSRQVEDYISRESGINLDKVFEQYLRTTMIPTLEYRIDQAMITYRWTNVVPGFAMPVRVKLSAGDFTLLRPTERWKTAHYLLSTPADFTVDENFYVGTKDLSGAPAGGP